MKRKKGICCVQACQHKEELGRAVRKLSSKYRIGTYYVHILSHKVASFFVQTLYCAQVGALCGPVVQSGAGASFCASFALEANN